MNKKLYLMGILVLAFFISTFSNCSYAQEYTQDDLKDIVVRFCDKIWDLEFKETIEAIPWKENKVRFCIYNNSTKKIPVTYGFSTATYNSVWTRVCQENTSTVNHDLILIPESKDRTVYVDAGKAVMVEEHIIIPPGISTWIQMGCLTAEIWWWAPGIDVWAMFFLKVRKAFDLDIIIWWMAAIQNTIKVVNTTWGVFSTNKKIKAEVDKENNLKLTFSLENDGNISQNIGITGKIYNVLGYQQEFVETGKTIVPNSTNTFVVDVGMLPAYKWLFSVKFTIQNDPQFVFPVSDEELKKSWYIQDQASVFIFSWIRVVALLLVVLIIYRLFVPKKAKIIMVPTASTPETGWSVPPAL